MSTAIERLLRSHGFGLARQRKHKVYKREDGTTFVTASTPSDWRAERNQLATLCRVLGTDKHRLLASLERRRRRIRAERAPAVPPIAVPPSIVENVPTKADEKLAKRLARIDRNRAAKAARGAEKFDLFFQRTAVLFVDSEEIVFADNRGLRPIMRAIKRHVEHGRNRNIPLSECYAARTDVTPEELLTDPNLLCLWHCAGCGGVTFIFKDGSYLGSNDPGKVTDVRDVLQANS